MYGKYDNVAEVEFGVLAKNTIHDDVTLDKIEYSDGDYECIKLYFSKKISKTVINRFIHQILPIKRWDDQTDESYEDSITNWNAIMKHISSKFGITFDQLKEATSTCTSFKEYADKYVALLTPVLKNAKLRLKIFSNKKGYGTLSLYPPFLENMADSKESTLSFTKWEKDRMTDWANLEPASDIQEVDQVLSEDDLDI